MDSIIQGIMFDGQFRVALIETSKILYDSRKRQNLSPLAVNALGRCLSIGAYESTNIKSKISKFNIIIESEAIINTICIAGKSEGLIKGFVSSRDGEAKQFKNTDLTVAIGRNGYFTVIRDLGLKEPYIGKTALVNGNIADDYAYHLYQSEGIKNAVGLDVIQENDKLFSFGLIFEALPDASDEAIVIVEDIMLQLNEILSYAYANGLQKTFDFYLAHLNSKILAINEVKYFCDCKEKSKDIVRSIGIEEAKKIIQENGKLELLCEYCNEYISFDEKDLREVFSL
ncbi:MAG TPA: Hsp33 family molecular chaperone HslO [Clostridia bacterium]|jgi:molecular chaperone Hsp33|nr:Hsp33 family molecular chaperone HslO [Clostridia bacterium]